MLIPRTDWITGETIFYNTRTRRYSMGIDARKKNSNSHKGSKHWNWKGGIVAKNIEIRKSLELRLWREAVFARDNWTCQKTGEYGGKINAHHIETFSQFPELRTSIENGITLSKKAHDEFHKKYGYKNNTHIQIKEFLNERTI